MSTINSKRVTADQEEAPVPKKYFNKRNFTEFHHTN